MKRTIHSLLILSLLSVFAFTSCNNYGKKIPIEGTKGEVFVKGEGVTETDGKNLGDYLKESGFLSADKGASIQLTKVGERYVVRFVYDKQYYNSKPELENVFKDYGVKISDKLFKGSKVDIILTDKSFNDFKSIPYDELAGKKEEKPEINPDTNPGGDDPNPKPENTVFSKDDYDHEKAGGVNFYWRKEISDKESKMIADYIVENGAFAGGTAEIYMSKDGDRYVLKFPVKEEYRTDQATINEIQKVSKQIKDNVFPNTPFSFHMVDEQLTALKTFDY